jgi:hypothetical protein
VGDSFLGLASWFRGLIGFGFDGVPAVGLWGCASRMAFFGVRLP